MSSFSPMKSSYFIRNCQPDMDATPQYGVAKRKIDDVTRKDFIDEIKEIREPINANVKSGQDGIRKVSAWRIPTKSYIGDHINFAVCDLNEIFNYRVSAIQDIQYLRYNVGDFYDWHSDIDSGAGSMRKISISYVLNSEFTGGELEIQHDGEKVLLTDKSNTLIAFTSFLHHRVRPVKTGIRECIVAWINGESWR